MEATPSGSPSTADPSRGFTIWEAAGPANIAKVNGVAPANIPKISGVG